MNNINLGAGTYGVQTASRRYFNKDVSELNLSEASVIAAIAQSPTNMNPIVHPENNAKRRTLVLDNMKRLGLCNEAEYEEAINDDVYSRIQSINEEQSPTSYYSYL
jgi:penicillin-binding protein 1A